jgi:A/G-specific adenine glycosylase
VRTPLVDGNVGRVLSRIDGSTASPASSAGKRALWARATELVQGWKGDPGTLNQALMELGALVCSPRKPACARCPVVSLCKAAESGEPTRFGSPGPRKKPVRVTRVAALIEDGEGRLLLARRKTGQLLGGLWEPPGRAFQGEEEADQALAHILEELGCPARVGAITRTVTHVFTHRRWEVTVFRAQPQPGWEPRPAGPYDAIGWHAPAERGLSTMAKKLLGQA